MFSFFMTRTDNDRQHTPATIEYNNKICNLYSETLRKHVVMYEGRLSVFKKAAGTSHPPDPSAVAELTRDTSLLGIVYTSFLLFTIIFVPQHGVYNAVVGRELLHWLNTNFLVTMEDEGTNLLKISSPWLHPSFWVFIKRSVMCSFIPVAQTIDSPERRLTIWHSCTLRLLFRPATHFLSSLAANHTHPATREISALLVTALNGMPNSEDYAREADYFDAHRQWKTGLYRLQRAVSNHATGARYEGKAELEEIVALVGGDSRVLMNMCNACGMSWRDAICVYGIWIQPSMTRLNLP